MSQAQTLTPGMENGTENTQLVTFTVGEIVLGVDIACVQEINRHLEVTDVPGASHMIRGVVNLRGDVVTVIDPHRVFGIEMERDLSKCRNLILKVDGERIGVMVDRVSDILTVQNNELTRRPSNVESIDRQFIQSVYLQSEQIVVVLNAEALVNAIEVSGEPVAA